MAVKTITIDMAAYTLLSRRKRPGESFSDVIKATFRPEPTVREFRETLKRVRLDRETIDAIERQIRRRRDDPARIVKL